MQASFDSGSWSIEARKPNGGSVTTLEPCPCVISKIDAAWAVGPREDKGSPSTVSIGMVALMDH